MNKLLKGSIAGAAGIALLLGGAGTLAYWNSSAGLDASAIDSGTLTITDNAATATTYYAGTTDPVTAAGIVPGDTVVITQGVDIVATGDNLEAKLEIDRAALVGAANAELENAVIISLKAYNGAVVPLNEVTGLDRLTSAEADSITTVVVTVELPSAVGSDAAFAGEAGDRAQTQELNLGALKLVLTQIPKL